jgi:hypothetical protein
MRDVQGGQFGGWAMWAMTLALFGRFERLLADTAELSRREGSFEVDIAFYRGLAAAALVSEPSQRKQRRSLRRILRVCSRRIERWRRMNPELEHMACALRAERARLRGRTPRALTLYGQAAERAAGAGYRHHAAFLHERKAALLAQLRRRVEANSELRKAIALYQEWGGQAKVEELSRAVSPASEPPRARA